VHAEILLRDRLCFLQFDSTVKLVNGILETTLVKEQFTTAMNGRSTVIGGREKYVLVVGWLTPFRECFQGLPERGHTVRNLAFLVLCNGELDMAEYKLVIQESGLVIICSRLLEVIHDKVYCSRSELIASGK
jgi:hypothetical protein